MVRPSPTSTVIVAVPVCPAAGVIVSVRVVPDPPNAKADAGTRVGLLLVARTPNAPGADSASATARAIVGPAWPLTPAWSTTSLMVGAVLVAGPPSTTADATRALTRFTSDPLMLPLAFTSVRYVNPSTATPTAALARLTSDPLMLPLAFTSPRAGGRSRRPTAASRRRSW
jgi:hypothetical protein